MVMAARRLSGIIGARAGSLISVSATKPSSSSGESVIVESAPCFAPVYRYSRSNSSRLMGTPARLSALYTRPAEYLWEENTISASLSSGVGGSGSGSMTMTGSASGSTGSSSGVLSFRACREISSTTGDPSTSASPPLGMTEGVSLGMTEGVSLGMTEGVSLGMTVGPAAMAASSSA